MQITIATGASAWIESNSGNAAMRAAADALQDFTNEADDATPDRLRQAATPPSTNAQRVSAGAGVVNAAAATANLAINIANLIARKNTDKTKTPTSLEIEITNESNGTIVVYSVDPANLDVSKVPQPIGKNASDIVLVTKPTGFDDDAAITIKMKVSGIDVQLTYSLVDDGSGTSDPMRWDVGITIGGQSGGTFSPSASLLGLTYVDSTVSFSLYTYGLTSPTGQIEVVVYDTMLPAAASTSFPTNGGGANVRFIDGANDVANAATTDLAAFQAPSSSSTDGPNARQIIPLITAAVGIISAVANIGNVGFGLAGQFGDAAQQATSDSLEFEITNNSSLPVVVYSVTSVRSSDLIARLPPPLIQGDADIVLLANPDGFGKDKPGNQGTSVTIALLIGGVPVTLTYTWKDGSPGRWQLFATANDSSLHTFDAELQLFAVQYAGTPGPFRLYSMPIETSTGQIDIVIYDLAPAT